MIYIDPPYNTGNDFIYNDNFTTDAKTYDEESGVVDTLGNRLFKNSKDGGRYHSDWCSMLFPRLKLAKNLLRDDGAIFVSIDDHEIHNLREMMNEIFGEDNFIATIIWQKVFAPKNTAKYLSEDHEYILVFAKDASFWLPTLLPRNAEVNERYQNSDNDPRGIWASDNLLARNYYSKGIYEVTSPSGKKFSNPTGTYWRVSYEKFLQYDKEKRIWWGFKGDSMPRQKRFLSDVKDGIVPQTLWKQEIVGNTQEAKKELIEFVTFEKTENVLNTVKPTRLLQRILQIATDKSDDEIILDFFSGSSSTAHAILNQNQIDAGKRSFIMVQIPEPLPIEESKLRTIADIGKERIRNVADKIQTSNTELTKQKKLDDKETVHHDLGFRIFKVDDTNMKDVYYSAADYSQETIEGLIDNVKEGRTDLDLLYQVLIDWGLPLNLPHEIEKIDNFHTHIVDKNALVACFDANIPESVMRKIAAKKPLRAVFRDGSFRSSPGKLNIEGIFRTIAPNTTLRVI
jgi:adenine-specific DNA-methyltransferase